MRHLLDVAGFEMYGPELNGDVLTNPRVIQSSTRSPSYSPDATTSGINSHAVGVAGRSARQHDDGVDGSTLRGLPNLCSRCVTLFSVSRTEYLTDEQWSLIEPLLPSSDGRRGRPFRDNRRVVEAIVYRYRAGVAWRDAPTDFGPWQTIWKRYRRYAGNGTWDKILTALLARADANRLVDWTVSVDSTICRAHQHDTNLARHPGGSVELHEPSP